MADRAAQGIGDRRPAARAPAQRQERSSDGTGRSAIPFILPMVVAHGRADPLAVHQCHSDERDGAQLRDRRNDERRSQELHRDCSASSDYLLAMQNTISFTIWSLADQVRRRHDHRPDPATAACHIANLMSAIMLLPWIVPEIVTALAWKSIYDPHLRRTQPDLAGPRAHRQAAWLAVGSADGDGQRDRRQRVEGDSLLHLAPACRPQSHRRASNSRRPRSTAPSAVQRFRHVTLPGLRYVHRRRPAALLHLDLQPVRPDLPDDRGRPGRRHPVSIRSWPTRRRSARSSTGPARRSHSASRR